MTRTALLVVATAAFGLWAWDQAALAFSYWWAARSVGMIADVDWDVVLSIVLGVSALGYAWFEHRRTSKLDDVADQHAAQLVELRILWTYAVEQSDFDAAITELRHQIEKVSERTEAPDVTALNDRTAVIAEAMLDHAERIATIEARIDHKPITQTRRKDGKFASPEEPKP